MSKYTLEITANDDYIDVRLNGEMTLEENFDVWKAIITACNNYKINNILGVSNLAPFDTLHAYEHTSIFEETGITFKHRIAWVELNPLNEPMVKFIETVLMNRGMVNGHLFKTEKEALNWLLNKNSKIKESQDIAS